MKRAFRHITGMLIVGGAVAIIGTPALARNDSASNSSSVQDARQVSMTSPQMAANAPFADKIQVGGRTLQLNGSGTRYKAVFQVYRAALYTEKPIQQYSELGGGTEPKRIHLVMMREVNANELGGMFVRGIQENMDKASAARMMPAMLRMSALFND